MREDVEQALEIWNDIELDKATALAPYFDPLYWDSKQEVLTL